MALLRLVPEQRLFKAEVETVASLGRQINFDDSAAQRALSHSTAKYSSNKQNEGQRLA